MARTPRPCSSSRPACWPPAAVADLPAGLKRTATVLIATGLAAAYLLNPALQHGNLEQFHPEAFLVLAVAVAIYAAVESRPVLLGVAVAASLLVKEDAALFMIPLAVWVYFRRDRTWGLRIAVGSVAWMVFAYTVVINTLLGTMSFYANRIPFGGLGGLVATVVAHPVRFWRYTRSDGRLFYSGRWVPPSVSGSWSLPELAAIGVLSVAENVLSTFPYMHQILYHYSMATVPVLALGTVFAVATVSRRGPSLPADRCGSGRGLRVLPVLGAGAVFPADVPAHEPDQPGHARHQLGVGLRAAQRVVSAYYPFVAHLDHRTRIYQWPTPFSAQYWGLYTEEGQRLPFAGQVQYLVLPALSRADQAVLTSISRQFVAVAHGGGVVVYKRVAR